MRISVSPWQLEFEAYQAPQIEARWTLFFCGRGFHKVAATIPRIGVSRSAQDGIGDTMVTMERQKRLMIICQPSAVKTGRQAPPSRSPLSLGSRGLPDD